MSSFVHNTERQTTISSVHSFDEIGILWFRGVLLASGHHCSPFSAEGGETGAFDGSDFVSGILVCYFDAFDWSFGYLRGLDAVKGDWDFLRDLCCLFEFDLITSSKPKFSRISLCSPDPQNPNFSRFQIRERSLL